MVQDVMMSSHIQRHPHIACQTRNYLVNIESFFLRVVSRTASVWFSLDIRSSSITTQLGLVNQFLPSLLVCVSLWFGAFFSIHIVQRIVHCVIRHLCRAERISRCMTRFNIFQAFIGSAVLRFLLVPSLLARLMLPECLDPTGYD